MICTFQNTQLLVTVFVFTSCTKI